ncbi:MAG: TlpA disulfide reductase family protein [Burkholderiales bacterium]
MAAVLVAAVAVAAGIGIYVALPQEETGTKAEPLPELQFQDGAGRSRSLADFRGKIVVLNLWATWCAPCREEMPALDRLQMMLGGPDFEVVALSIDQQGPQVVRKFFDEMGIKALQPYIDPTAQAGFKVATRGLPTTVIVDRQGREVRRRVGPAEWDAPKLVDELRGMIETR